MDLLGPYLDPAAFVARWAALAKRHAADTRVIGVSVEGRPIVAHTFGRTGPIVLMTALIHGIEVVGSHALLGALERLLGRGVPDAKLVVVPIANPDAYTFNMERALRGSIAWRRGNARGVDLNRNFPRVGDAPWHPFAGSSIPWSPHYVGPAPCSEPESQALVDLARELQPTLSIGFHSFGELLLYPWAHTRAPNPRRDRYHAIGDTFARAMRVPYKVGQATTLYPTMGDLDDFLDHELGTLAYTVEVGALDRRLLHPLRAANPFAWMNPSNASDLERTADDLARATAAMMDHALAA